MAYEFRDWPTQYRHTGNVVNEAGREFLRHNRLTSAHLIGPLPAKYLNSQIEIDPGPKAKLKDLVSLSIGMLVSERFRTLVEGFEPGVHFFYPVELIRKKGPVHEPYYFFLPGQRIDAILITGKPGAYHYGLENRGDVYDARWDYPGITHGTHPVLSRPAIEGKHIWVPDEVGYGTFVSDEFRKRCKKAKLTNAHFLSCEESDEPWDREKILAPVFKRLTELGKGYVPMGRPITRKSDHPRTPPKSTGN